MKLVLTSMIALCLQVTVANAYVKDGACADVAAKAARTYAASSWNIQESNLKIQISRIFPSSNPAPIEMYGVGIKSQKGNPVLFVVSLKNINGACTDIEAQFAEYLE